MLSAAAARSISTHLAILKRVNRLRPADERLQGRSPSRSGTPLGDRPSVLGATADGEGSRERYVGRRETYPTRQRARTSPGIPYGVAHQRLIA
jgi:hypothetical protein